MLERVRRFEGAASLVRCVVFSPDGRTLAASDDKTVRLYDLATGKAAATLEGHTDTIRALAFSPDGRLLASVSDDQTVRLWDPATAQAAGTLQGHTDRVWATAFSPDGKTLASGGFDRSIRLWDVATHKLAATLEGRPAFGITALAFSPDGKSLAGGAGGGTIQMWDLAASRCTTLCADTDEYVAPRVVFSPDGNMLATAAHCNMRQAVLLWDLSTGKLTQRLTAHGLSGVSALAFAPNGKTLISAGWSDRQIKLWDPATGACIATFGKQGATSCGALSPDGKTLALVAIDKSIGLWQLPATAATQPATQPSPASQPVQRANAPATVRP
jgi:WD40 repeat protein